MALPRLYGDPDGFYGMFVLWRFSLFLPVSCWRGCSGGRFWGVLEVKMASLTYPLWTLAFWSCFRRFSACMTLSTRFPCQKVSKSGVFVQKLPLPHSTTENATKMSCMQFCRVFCLKTPISTPKSLKTVLFAIYRVFVLFSSTSCIYRSDLAILAFYRKRHV